MNSYYYVDASKQKAGPVSPEDFKRLGITAQTLVWTKGMKSWTKAGQIPDLETFVGSEHGVADFTAPHSDVSAPEIHSNSVVETTSADEKQDSICKKYKLHMPIALVVVVGTLLLGVFVHREPTDCICHYTDDVSLCSELDSVGYAYGVVFGSQYANFQDSGTVVPGKVMGLDNFILGFVSAIRRDSASLVISVADADVFLKTFQRQVTEESQK